MLADLLAVLPQLDDNVAFLVERNAFAVALSVNIGANVEEISVFIKPRAEAVGLVVVPFAGVHGAVALPKADARAGAVAAVPAAVYRGGSAGVDRDVNRVVRLGEAAVSRGFSKAWYLP